VGEGTPRERGEPRLLIVIEHDLLPVPAVIEAQEEWLVERVARMRETLRMGVSEPSTETQ
jgi:hypothetical protein